MRQQHPVLPSGLHEWVYGEREWAKDPEEGVGGGGGAALCQHIPSAVLEPRHSFWLGLLSLASFVRPSSAEPPASACLALQQTALQQAPT